MKPGRELRFAAELADTNAQLRERLLSGIAGVLGIVQDMGRKPLDAVSVAGAKGLERALVAVLSSLDQDRIAELLVDERPVGPRFLWNVTALAQGGLHGGD
jgi:hypothetical protein